jgi:A/G-specific adenine glycosylase
MRWYHEQGRHDLPWRLTRDPYAVLVSEVMLQQTQVDRVLPYYHAWLQRWPTIESLARATPADVIRAWAGLGYNRRALNLHRVAVAVMERHGGILPREPALLRRLPGIGPYTAAAVASFAFEERCIVADTNIGRVVARGLGGQPSQKGLQAGVVETLAIELLPLRDARSHNLALMDLGALVCRARTPDCSHCPILRHCAWASAGSPEGLPERTGRIERFEDSARYARGRIVDLLRRHSSLSVAAIAGQLPRRHRERTPEYLESLRRDGLVENLAGDWCLPGPVRAE